MPVITEIVSTNQQIEISNTAGEGRGTRSVISSKIVLKEFEDSTLLVSKSLGESFVSFLQADRRIERVYWAFESGILRIWTIVNEPDAELEASVSNAELQFMDRFPELECDFSVIYRLGKRFEDIIPTGSILAYPLSIHAV